MQGIHVCTQRELRLLLFRSARNYRIGAYLNISCLLLDKRFTGRECRTFSEAADHSTVHRQDCSSEPVPLLKKPPLRGSRWVAELSAVSICVRRRASTLLLSCVGCRPGRAKSQQSTLWRVFQRDERKGSLGWTGKSTDASGLAPAALLALGSRHDRLQRQPCASQALA